MTGSMVFSSSQCWIGGDRHRPVGLEVIDPRQRRRGSPAMERLSDARSAEKIHGVVRYAMDDVRRLICPFDAGLTLDGREAQVGDVPRDIPRTAARAINTLSMTILPCLGRRENGRDRRLGGMKCFRPSLAIRPDLLLNSLILGDAPWWARLAHRGTGLCQQAARKPIDSRFVPLMRGMLPSHADNPGRLASQWLSQMAETAI